MNTPAPIADHYRYRFLMGAMQLGGLIQTVRLLCIPDDVQKLDAITGAWVAASARMTQLGQQEAGEPDKVNVSSRYAGRICDAPTADLGGSLVSAEVFSACL